MGFILDYFLIEITILLATWIAWSYYKFQTEGSKFWSKRNVPHLPPVFLFGNHFLDGFKENASVGPAKMYLKHKNKRILGYWATVKPVLTVFDLDILKNILVRDFSYFNDRFHLSYDKNDPLTGHLFNLNGQMWRNLRVKLTPTFTSGKMKMMYPTMLQCANDLDEKLAKSAEEGAEIEAKDVLSKFTMNVIARCAFGIDTDAFNNPDSKFIHYVQKVVNPSATLMLKGIVMLVFPSLWKLFQMRLMPKDSTEFFINLVKNTVEYRRMNSIERNDFMQLLIQLMEKGQIVDVDNKHRAENDDEQATKFSLEEAAAQAFVFFLAGFETSSATMSFCLYELGKNKEVQSKLQEEIRKAINADDGEIRYETIWKLPYLDMVIKETLRKYPVVPFLMREVTKDYYLSEFDANIPEGTLVFISLLGMSMDPDLFKNPDQFDPERFSQEEIDKRHPFSSIPFGEGPRMCIGQRFGMMQTKMGLSTILRKYTIELLNDKPITFEKTASFLKVEGGINIKLHKK